jgi:hypothetical protein
MIIEACRSCQQPVRRSIYMVQVALLLDPQPCPEGTFFYNGLSGQVSEDNSRMVTRPRFRRHHCGDRS